VTFDSIPDGSALFLDTNPFVYSFTADPSFGPACERLLERIEYGQLQGYTSAHVLSEMVHRLITMEAAALLGRPLAGLANWLKRHPTEVQRLGWHKRGVDEVRAIGVRVLPVEGADVSHAADTSSRLGLLTNDALLVVLMQRHGLSLLASLDADFDRVPGITRCTPI
jgi:predicted nucleic acid-binding protein